ncbi:MAG TPA: hypothetical protein PLV85_17320, partial [Polyangiaceae bacterium]|nr:hypothetical protein [Polyangiaceae bacterium]
MMLACDAPGAGRVHVGKGKNELDGVGGRGRRDYWFIDSRNSWLFCVREILSRRNSIESMTL